MKNYYEILGVPRDANSQAIRRAFKSLSQMLHPDKGGSPAEFREVRRAYETLKDPAKRIVYDASLDSDINPLELQARVEAFAEMIVTSALNELVSNRQNDMLLEIMNDHVQSKRNEATKSKSATLRSRTALRNKIDRIKGESTSIIIKLLHARLTEANVRIADLDLTIRAADLFSVYLSELSEEQEFVLPDFTSWSSSP